MLCLTNSPLVANMVNDLLNHQDQPYLPHLIGVHACAGRYLGTHLFCRHAVVVCVNEADNPVTRVFPDGSTAEIKWGRAGKAGRIFAGHLPQLLGHALSMGPRSHGASAGLSVHALYVPGAKWSGQPIFKNNPRDYLNGMGQMIQAMRCVLTGQPFVINQYAPLSEDVTFKINALIQMLENTDASVRTRAGRSTGQLDIRRPNALARHRHSAPMPGWMNTSARHWKISLAPITTASTRPPSAMSSWWAMLRTDAAITIQENPQLRCAAVQLASRSGRPVYIGPMSRSSTPLGGIKVLLPTRGHLADFLQLVMVDGRQALETGAGENHH